MMTLITLAITVAFGTSLAATFGLFEVEVWWELASLITIMVLGHWLEMRAISQARGALNALATANVGIAIGAGTDVAIESAGIVLVRSDPRDVVGAIELSRATYRKMIQNLVWATAYNLVAIPVAAGLFLRWGLELPMSVGAIAMSLSTIIVAANAQLLRGLKLGRGAVVPIAPAERAASASA